MVPFLHSNDFILYSKKEKSSSRSILSFRLCLPSVLVLKLMLMHCFTANVNANELSYRLENMKKLLAPVIYSLKVVSSIGTPLMFSKYFFTAS